MREQVAWRRRRWRLESRFDLLGALYRGDVARAAQLETGMQHVPFGDETPY